MNIALFSIIWTFITFTVTWGYGKFEIKNVVLEKKSHVVKVNELSMQALIFSEYSCIY